MTSFPDGEPDELNGYKTRKQYGPCPECKVPENKWCDESCTRLDLGDYR